MWGHRFVVAVWASLMVVAASGCDRQSSNNRGARAAFAARPEVLDFGPAAVGSAKTVKLKLANEGRAPVRVEGATVSVPNVEVLPFEPFSLSAGGEHEVEVRFAPEVEGTVQGVVEIFTDADSSEKASQVAFSGHGVKAWVEVKDRALDFGNVALDTVVVRQLVLHNPTSVNSPLRFEVTGPDADEFSSSAMGKDTMVQAGQDWPLPVAFKASRLGSAVAELRVMMCEGCEPAIVSLSGTGIASQLEISPVRVDFGRVAVGATAEERIMVRNQGTEPMVYTGASIVANTSGVFRVTSAQAPAGNVLKPGGSAEIRVAFTPVALGQVPEGRVEIQVRAPSSTAPTPKVGMAGVGGSSCIVVLPRAVDFGEVPESMSATRQVEVINRCASQVLLSDLKLDTTKGGFFTLAQAPSSQPLEPGKSTSVGITFTPRAGTGAAAGHMAVTTRQGSANATEGVTLSGLGRVFKPCQYSLSPQVLDFGRVPVGSEVALGVTLRNTGTTACFLSSMQVSTGSDAVFGSARVENTVLQAGQRTQLLVRFKPDGSASFAGLAEAWVNNPTSGHPTVSIQGEGVVGCFSVQPTHLEFGLTKLTCEPRTRDIIAYNTCTGPVTVQGMTLEHDSPAFQVASAPSFPLTLPAGESFHVRTVYAPTDEGQDLAALRFDLGEGSVYTASMAGQAAENADRTDTFTQDAAAKVDVLFVIDNSGSMMEEQQNLGANFAAFLSSAIESGADYQIATTSSGLDPSSGGWSQCPGGAEGGENGRLFPVDGSSPRIITPSTPDAASVFATNTHVGVCHWNEQGLDGAYRALSAPLLHSLDDPRTSQAADGNGAFLRPEARLAIIFISDEQDFSSQPVPFYETYFKSLKDNDASKLSVSAIVGPADLASCSTASSSGTRYIQLAEATGGVVESICTPNWASSLKKLSDTTFGSRRNFPLSDSPVDSASISVRVNGSAVTTHWHYEASTNTVLFDVGAAPAPGAVVEIVYPVDC